MQTHRIVDMSERFVILTDRVILKDSDGAAWSQMLLPPQGCKHVYKSQLRSYC